LAILEGRDPPQLAVQAKDAVLPGSSVELQRSGCGCTGHRRLPVDTNPRPTRLPGAFALTTRDAEVSGRPQPYTLDGTGQRSRTSVVAALSHPGRRSWGAAAAGRVRPAAIWTCSTLKAGRLRITNASPT